MSARFEAPKITSLLHLNRHPAWASRNNNPFYGSTWADATRDSRCWLSDCDSFLRICMVTWLFFIRGSRHEEDRYMLLFAHCPALSAIIAYYFASSILLHSIRPFPCIYSRQDLNILARYYLLILIELFADMELLRKKVWPSLALISQIFSSPCK